MKTLERLSHAELRLCKQYVLNSLARMRSERRGAKTRREIKLIHLYNQVNSELSRRTCYEDKSDSVDRRLMKRIERNVWVLEANRPPRLTWRLRLSEGLRTVALHLVAWAVKLETKPK